MATPFTINMIVPKRERTKYERQRTWIVIASVGTVILLGLAAAIYTGLFAGVDAYWFGRNLRGYTAFGLFFGVLSVVLMFGTFFYTIRKRSRQETLSPRIRSTMAAWLWAHIYIGLLSLVAAVLHAGLGIVGGNLFSTGKVLFYLLALLVLSGVLWRLIYNGLPSRAQPKIVNYSDSVSAERAAQMLLEIEKVAAGKSDDFRAMVTSALAGSQNRAALSQLNHAEQTDMEMVLELVEKRNRALKRKTIQIRTTRLLQGFKYAHIPLVFGFVIMLFVHIIAVTNIPTKAAPVVLGGWHPVTDCADCHQEIVQQWTESMHAHALTSPVTIAQTNQVYKENVINEDVPDPQLICNNCHGPAGVLMTGQDQATLPLDPPNGISQEHVMEGVNCVTCHQFTGESAAGKGGLSAFQDGLEPGNVFYGEHADSVGNAYHRGQQLPLFETPETLCQNCHNVMVDRDGDGREEDAGIDLVLQTTYREYEQEYQALGGVETCVTCHMPRNAGARGADSAEIPLEQDYTGPERAPRSHSFVGVDYPLDTVAQSDPQQAEREALLQSAARFALLDDTIQIDPVTNELSFTISVDNNDLGHKLPTGFAFTRQMWVEVIVRDQSDTVIFTSGVLASNEDDLCDTETFQDTNGVLAAMSDFVQGCVVADAQLVNFQQKLVTDVEPLRDENGAIVRDDYGNTVGISAERTEETPLQNLNGGAVARVRPSDGQILARISPDDDERQYVYTTTVSADVTSVTIETRLLFRNLPPYFLRALAVAQPPEEQNLAPLIPNLKIVEMGKDTGSFAP